MEPYIRLSIMVLALLSNLTNFFGSVLMGTEVGDKPIEEEPLEPADPYMKLSWLLSVALVLGGLMVLFFGFTSVTVVLAEPVAKVGLTRFFGFTFRGTAVGETLADFAPYIKSATGTSSILVFDNGG